jgi:hypothetical protein
MRLPKLGYRGCLRANTVSDYSGNWSLILSGIVETLNSGIYPAFYANSPLGEGNSAYAQLERSDADSASSRKNRFKTNT